MSEAWIMLFEAFIKLLYGFAGEKSKVSSWQVRSLTDLISCKLIFCLLKSSWLSPCDICRSYYLKCLANSEHSCRVFFLIEKMFLLIGSQSCRKSKTWFIFIRNTLHISWGSIIVLRIVNALNLVRIAFIWDYYLFSGVFVCINWFFCR